MKQRCIHWLKVSFRYLLPMYMTDRLKGRPVQDPTTQTVLRGSPLRGGGLALLEDTQLIETLAHFPRERIPER
jgi:catalase